MIALIPLLADGAPDVAPGFFKDWVTVAVFIFGAVSSVWGFTRKPSTDRTITNDPINVRAHEEFVQRREFEQHKEHMSRVHGEIKQGIDKRFDDLKEERRESINNLHSHINGAVTRIEHKIDQSDDRTAERLKDGNKTMAEHGELIAGITKGMESLEREMQRRRTH